MHDTPKPPHSKSGFTFYTNLEYWARLVELIRATKPGDRVLLMTMTFEPTEPAIAAVASEVTAAAARGVTVDIAVDAHSFLLDGAHRPGPLWVRRTLPKKMRMLYRNKFDILEAINACPTGRADIINVPQRNIKLAIAGRSHIKAAIINDQIFLGGCNLQGSLSVDMMVGWQDKTVANRLHTTLLNIIHHRHAGRALSWVDRSMSLGNNTNILIDSGMRNQSLILDEALQLIDSAERWLVITCQFFPNSITARHLTNAVNRGVKVQVIYAHPRHHGLIGGTGQQMSILWEKTRAHKSLFEHALTRKDPMLHAKLIASDQGVMIGSHNYVSAGVLLGTAEIALKSGDPQLAQRAVETLQRSLQAAKQS